MVSLNCTVQRVLHEMALAVAQGLALAAAIEGAVVVVLGHGPALAARQADIKSPDATAQTKTGARAPVRWSNCA